MAREREPHMAEPIKERARQGMPLGIPIIDAHGHIGPVGMFYGPASSPAALVATMDRVGVQAMAISANRSLTSEYRAGNREVAEAADAFPGRFIGYATANPNYPAAEIEAELEGWLTRHRWMRGIKLHPTLHQYPITGPNYRVAFEVAARHGAPVLVHTWVKPEESALCAPLLCAQVAERYPDVPVLLGHSGGVLAGYREAVEAAQRQSNVYLETCSSFQSLGAIEYFVDSVGADRVLFGSDACWHTQKAAIGKIAFARLSTEEKRQVLGLNAARLFRLKVAAPIIAGDEQRGLAGLDLWPDNLVEQVS